jgi:hypothetical protein
MEQPRYDEGHWPLVLVTMPAEELSEVDLIRHIDRLTAFTKRGVPYVQLIDVRTAASLSARARRLVAERMDQDEEAYPGVLAGVGIVLATSLHRGIFKAISWLSRNPRPFEAFSELDEAMVWARRLIAVAPAHSVTLPIATDVTKRVG